MGHKLWLLEGRGTAIGEEGDAGAAADDRSPCVAVLR
jgi:hypothetical protein